MVLYKRKPVQLLPLPTTIPDNAEIFVMKSTNEVFTDYERYLQRLDFLSQKKFVDAVNGKSGLTYFAALESERKSSTAIESLFPEVLRDPILRKVQFSVTARMDDLVNDVFNEFRHDFFPGEEVICTFEDGEQLTGVVSEKAKFPMIRGPTGEVQRAAFSRYFVRFHDIEETGLLSESFIRRDRKLFTKVNLRAFLKHSLQRQNYNGAPWLVREPLAIQYRLPMEIPAHLLQDAKMLANKQMPQTNHVPRRRPKNMSPEEFKRVKQEEAARMQQHLGQQPGAPSQAHSKTHHEKPVPAPRVEVKQPPPPPVIKYPIEDLDVAPKRDGVKRPKLKFFNHEEEFSGTTADTIGMLLETWNTLNVQCEVYVLDSFTFDDFVDAMNYQSNDTVPCELLEEAFCAVLKLIVDDKGNLTLTKGALPKLPEESSSDSEEQEESEVSTPVADVPARSTRSRLSQVETIVPETAEKAHRAQEVLGDRDWITRLGERDFEDGGWQVILVGLLYNLSLAPNYKARCDEVLAELAPIDEDATRETARVNFANLDINLRTSALQMITILSIATPSVKDFLETCADDMTDVRKRKIEYQKQKKIAIEELAVKDRDRKILLPENMAPESPKQENEEPTSVNGDGTEDSIDVGGGASVSDSDDEGPSNGRGLRRGNDRKRKREEEAARAAEEKARKAEAAKKENKQSREFKKLLNEIEDLKAQILDCENKIIECDDDLREANVQRTRVLGKDRFCNRYWWFERNGQPFGGLPRSSTAGYGYANGRIWVQGPDPMELQAFIGETKEEQLDYQRRFNLSIPERRRLEEGETVLSDSRQWGYYDDPDIIDNLIHWLDERGDREKPLRKEFTQWRDTIVQYMNARKQFLDEETAKKIEAEEEHQNQQQQQTSTRISTRRQEREELLVARQRCLKWSNSMALEESGHIHSQAAPPKPKARGARSSAGGAAAPAVAPRQTRGVAVPVNRHGKPLTRQG